MESITYLKNLKISPKKLRFFLDVVKKLKPIEAMNQLYYGRQHAAKILYQAIKSSIANGKQTLKTSEDLLNFKLFTIEEGSKLKRHRPGSRGSPKPIMRRKSHIKIILTAVDKSKIKIEDKDIKKENKTLDKKVDKKIELKVKEKTK